MIRHSIHTGLGRGRPELTRLSEGIATSLRQFSIAQARCAADDGTASSKPSSNRQRSAAAANELLSMNNERVPRSSNKSDSASRAAPSTTTAQIPKVINVTTLRGGSQNRFTGVRRVSEESDTRPRQSSGSPAASGGVITGGIIRGGFRGRGRGDGGSFAGRGGGSFAARRGGASNENFRPRRGRGGARGRGKDDRPMRDRRPNREEREENEEYERFKASGKDVEPELTAYNEAIENGIDRAYQPTAPKSLFAELAGYAPSVATNASPLGKSSTAITQARMLAGGHPYHPEDWPALKDAKQLYKEGHGVFFPSAEAKAWATKNTRKVDYGNPPEETKTAILDAALLGKYDGPKYAEPKDTVGTVRSYVKRHGTWNAAAERSIEARVKGLLPALSQRGPVKAQAKRS